jgi:predicted HTH domain antitoxin
MNATTHDDDDMPAEVDFVGAERGKFHRPNLRLNLPVYLDAEVQDYLNVIAAKKGMPLSQLANELLKREIGIIEAVK